MIYTDKTMLAMRIAYKAHDGQIDKVGVPYIMHPLHVAESMPDESTTIVALLHDVLEDTNVCEEELAIYFSDEVMTALKLLTHEKGVPYMDYITNLKNNRIAKIVKIADLQHNSDTTRCVIVDASVKKRVKKYKKAILLLKD